MDDWPENPPEKLWTDLTPIYSDESERLVLKLMCSIAVYAARRDHHEAVEKAKAEAMAKVRKRGRPRKVSKLKPAEE